MALRTLGGIWEPSGNMIFLENKISVDNMLGDMYSTENIEVKQKGLQRWEIWEENKIQQEIQYSKTHNRKKELGKQ